MKEELVAEPEEEASEEPQQEEVVETEEQVEDAVKFVTAEDLEKTKEDILEAVKTLMQPATEDQAVKAEDESEEETTKDDEDLDELRKKDLKIAELEKKIFDLEAKLKSANKSRSKGIPPHFDSGKVVKNLYEDDNRDLYGRVIK